MPAALHGQTASVDLLHVLARCVHPVPFTCVIQLSYTCNFGRIQSRLQLVWAAVEIIYFYVYVSTHTCVKMGSDNFGVEETSPSWGVALLFVAFLLISVVWEAIVHRVQQYFKSRPGVVIILQNLKVRQPVACRWAFDALNA